MLQFIGPAISIIGTILDKFVGDKDLKAKLNAEIQARLIELDLAQAQTNLEQAKHPSIFVAGARPAIMWVCCLAFVWQFIIAPVAAWWLALYQPDLVLPALETESLMTLMFAMLGLGGMRTAEKFKGVARENMKE